MKQMPHGWKHVCLGDHVDLITGYPFSSEEYTDNKNSVKLIRGVNIGQGFLKWEDTAYWSVEEINKYKDFELAVGDVVLAMDRTWISAGIKFAWIHENEIPSLLVQRVARIRGRKDLLTGYIRHLFATHDFTNHIKVITAGTNVPHISSTDIKSFKFPLPPLPEQIKIADILSTWDEAIAKTELLIAALQRRKKGLMQRLLTGEVRFPGFNGEWQEVELQNIAKIIMGQSPGSLAYNDLGKGLPLIQGNADISNRKTAPKIYTSEITKRCNIGDIILSVRAPVGETATSIHSACIGRGVCAIRATKSNSRFLYHLLVSCEQRWQKFAQGSTFTAINSTDIRQFTLLIPPRTEEQAQIAKVFDTCDKEIDLHIAKLKALKQQKKGLMQRLLTGQVRVKV